MKEDLECHKSEEDRTPWVRRLAQRLWAGFRYSRGLRELQGLDDHLLNDIGLSRWDVQALARGERLDSALKQRRRPYIKRPVALVAPVEKSAPDAAAPPADQPDLAA